MRPHWVVLAAALAVAGNLPLARAEPGADPAPFVTHDALPLGIPVEKLSKAARDRAEGVVAQSLFAQQVTGIRYRSREAVFEFLLDHPDFAASVARALHLGQYRVTALGDGYWGDDGRGARGMIRVLYAEPGQRLYHLEGRYESHGLPTIEGQLLVRFEFRHEEDGDGGSVMDSSLTGHLRIDTPFVGALARVAATLSRPLIEHAVERKVRRFFNTVARLSRWAYDEPEQVDAALDGHPDVPPGPTLAAFRDILLAGRPPAWVRRPYRLLLPETADP